MDKLKISAKLFNDIMKTAEKFHDRTLLKEFTRTVHFTIEGDTLYAGIMGMGRVCLITGDYISADDDGEGMVVPIMPPLGKGAKWCEMVIYDGDLSFLTNLGVETVDASRVKLFDPRPFFKQAEWSDDTLISYQDIDNIRRSFSIFGKKEKVEVIGMKEPLLLRSGNKQVKIFSTDKTIGGIINVTNSNG